VRMRVDAEGQSYSHTCIQVYSILDSTTLHTAIRGFRLDDKPHLRLEPFYSPRLAHLSGWGPSMAIRLIGPVRVATLRHGAS